MRPEIETLKKLATGTINKGRLATIRAAQAEADELLHHLEPKPGDENAAVKFDNAQPEDAEEKEDREQACDAVGEKLHEAITSLETIIEVAVVSAVKHVPTEEEDIARAGRILSLPQEERARAAINWLDSSPTPEIKQRRLKAIGFD
jgi:uncharacterized protein (DUF885 family)